MWSIVLVRKGASYWEVRLNRKDVDIIGELRYTMGSYPVYYPISKGVDLPTMEAIMREWNLLKERGFYEN